MTSIIAIFCVVAFAQRPDEIVRAGRTADDHQPVISFKDVSQWRVETDHAVAKAEYATDRILFGDGACKITYRGTDGEEHPMARTIVLWVLPTSDFGIEGLTVIQQRTMAIFVFAALMWLFEIIPAWATSVTTIVALLFAVSNKGFMVDGAGAAVNYKEIMASFADPVIMLFLGGFVLAIAANKVGLDAYLARTLLHIFGNKPKYVLLGLLLVPGTFSMFMSNTATAAMMLAFMAPVLKNLPKDSAAPAALTLAIPIAANFGGLGTPIGTPPNAIALGALTKVGIDISFGSWVIHMVPKAAGGSGNRSPMQSCCEMFHCVARTSGAWDFSGGSGCTKRRAARSGSGKRTG